mgnify:CR=1 FL=1
MVAPPIKANEDGVSLININAQSGPKIDSDNIIIPTIAEGVVLAPIVIKMKPNPTWKQPAKNPKKISWGEIIIFVERKKPMTHELKPATNCAGTISTCGYFLTIIIKIANVIGIVKAAKFPESSPGERELPTINNTPIIAKIIENKVMKLIFSLRKKYPNIAKNNIWREIIKLVFATVVLYIAKTYPQKPIDKITPPMKPGNPEI